MLPFALLLALVWGVSWALFLQFTRLGHFLALKRAWVTVIVGIGADLLIILIFVPFDLWWQIALVIVLSSLAIIYRSLHNELSETEEQLDAYQGAP